ncbi:class I SAM-dependent methyltransferase [Celeribacter sp.]|uniref:class I SAM-dependent methyltransferase n=1 Tax=Celeribacter sp. TaxID=1890673 RepID=UPI003A8EEFAB
MLSDRLPLVLSGQPVPARVVVIRPRAHDDLSAFEGAQVQVVTGFKPDFDHFDRLGFGARVDIEGTFDLAVVCVPRAKAQARALIAAASACAGSVIVDGQKTDGIDSITKDIKKRAESIEVVSKAHGKSVRFSGGDFSDWADTGPLSVIDGFETRLGVFSADRIDKASALLVETLPAKLPQTLADLGAGWGFLSRHILTRDAVTELHVVEAERAAIDCARANVSDPRAQFHWADATTFKPPHLLGGVIMNPPFHTSRAADPSLGQAFIAAAAGMLAPNGQLWLVANRQLPYEAALTAHFARTTEIGGNAGFKVLHAEKPFRNGRGRV